MCWLQKVKYDLVYDLFQNVWLSWMLSIVMKFWLVHFCFLLIVGPNPLFGGLKSTKSIFGRSSHTWIDGEGMLHAVYIDKDSDGRWIVQYDNRHVETETYKQEKQRNRPSFLPAIEGDPLAILSAYLLNAVL